MDIVLTGGGLEGHVDSSSSVNLVLEGVFIVMILVLGFFVNGLAVVVMFVVKRNGVGGEEI